MSPPLVSVLLPCFNAEAFVATAMESVRAQTYTSIEVIAVDDGSSDDTVRILKGYREQGAKIVLQEGKGASAARNRALAEAQGQFVLFLDSDDLIGSRHIERLIARMDGSDDCIAMGEWDRIVSTPDDAAFPHRETYRDWTGTDFLIEDWSAGRPMTQCGTFLIPRARIEKLGGWDERLTLNDDFEFFARLLAGDCRLRFAPRARLYYRSSVAGSLSGRKSRAAVESACLSLLLGTKHLLAAEDSPRSQLAAANMLKTFDYTIYPAYPALRRKVCQRVKELGGSTLAPDGPPGFHKLHRFVGWKGARLVENLVQCLRARDSRSSRTQAVTPTQELRAR